MPFVSRATLTQEFKDTLSSMLLVQPEPQYLHAGLIKMALAGSLSTDASYGLPGRDGIGAQGADYGSPEDDRLALDEQMYSEAIMVVPELGKGDGHTVRINRPVYADTTYTQDSREVPNGTLISTTPINVRSEQVSVQIKRFFGPYDSVNSRVAPFGIDRFDASRSTHSLAKVVGRHLKRDLDKFLDKVGVTLGDLGANAVYPKGMSAVNDSVVAGDYPMDMNTLTRAEQKADELNLPTFGNGRRMLVLTPQQCQQLSDDSQWSRMSEFHAPANALLAKAYYKSFGGLDIFKSNTLSTTNNSSTVAIHYGQLIAPGALGFGWGRLPETATSTADNFGEHALVGWITEFGCNVLDDRFLISVRSS